MVQTERLRITEADLREEGRMAHSVGLTLRECPYDLDTQKGLLWIDGWLDSYYGVDVDVWWFEESGEHDDA